MPCRDSWEILPTAGNLEGEHIGWNQVRSLNKERLPHQSDGTPAETVGPGILSSHGARMRRWRKLFRGRAWKGPRQGDPQGGRYLPRSTVKFTAQQCGQWALIFKHRTQAPLLWSKFENSIFQDFPGGPGVKNLPSVQRKAGSISDQRAKIPHAWGQPSPSTAAPEQRIPHASCLKEDPTQSKYK